MDVRIFSHPDGLLLAAVAQQCEDAVEGVDHTDGAAAHAAVERIVGSLADVESVRAMAAERTDPILETPEMILFNPHAALRSIWMDAFTIGALFAQQHGDRPGHGPRAD